jgi:polyisoprenoid-binding protein YceI
MNKMIIDYTHSEIGFKVKHLMISTVRGNFGTFGGEINENGDLTFSLEVDSINTNNSDRDNHLKNTDFFDVENHPRITFVANNVDITSGLIAGELTIKGITKELIMTSEYNGVSVDPWGNTKHGLEITGKVNRSDFGLTWNAPLETGGVLVSDEVIFNIDLQLLEMIEAPVSEMAQ